MGKRREEGNRRKPRTTHLTPPTPTPTQTETRPTPTPTQTETRPTPTPPQTTTEEGGGGGYYDRSICLRAHLTDAKGDETDKWYVLNLSSSRRRPEEERDEEEEEEEEVGLDLGGVKKRLRRSNSKDAAYMAFYHSLGHLEDDVSQRPVLVPIPKLNLIPPRFNSLENPLIAGMGSNIYRLGGQTTTTSSGAPRLSRKVIYLDNVVGKSESESKSKSKSKSNWRRGPSMNTGRSADGAQAVLLHGKLYVFGGVGAAAPAPWAEVFDPYPPPASHYWTPLPPPQHSLVSSGLLRISGGVTTDLVEDDTTTTSCIMLLGFDGSTYAYNVMAETWKTLDPHFFFTRDALKRFTLRCGPASVLANNTVYWFDLDFRLNAYDLGSKILYSGNFQDLNIHYHLMHCAKNGNHKPFFTHLAGDLFSYIWFSNELWPVDNTDWNFRSVLHCTNFRVSKFAHKQGIFSLSASVVSCRTYVVKQNLVLHYIHGYQLK